MRTRDFALRHYPLSRNHDIRDPNWWFFRMFYRRLVNHSCRVEDDQIGNQAGRNAAPVFQPQLFGRQLRHAVNHVFKRSYMLLANIVPQHARK